MHGIAGVNARRMYCYPNAIRSARPHLEEMRCLIALWRDSTVQAPLETCYKPHPIYKDVAKQMANRCDTSSLRWQYKLKHLKVSYSEGKDNHTQQIH